LKKYKYPPDQEKAAVNLVLEQVEALGEEWGD
jgi:type I restriction enzyme R subunit